MKNTFADTYFLLALMNARDASHREAIEISDALTGPIVTTHWILVEVADAFSQPRDRERFVKLLELIATDNRVLVVPATSELFDRATELFAQRMDKSWSLTDCTSFVTMEQHGITEALTGDRHFAQAGFTTLLAGTQ